MAFLPNSRYANIGTVKVAASVGPGAAAVKLRRLPVTDGTPYLVVEGDRIDIVAYRSLADSTQAWRVADANSELQMETLTAAPGGVILVPSD